MKCLNYYNIEEGIRSFLFGFYPANTRLQQEATLKSVQFYHLLCFSVITLSSALKKIMKLCYTM